MLFLCIRKNKRTLLLLSPVRARSPALPLLHPDLQRPLRALGRPQPQVLVGLRALGEEGQVRTNKTILFSMKNQINFTTGGSS